MDNKTKNIFMLSWLANVEAAVTLKSDDQNSFITQAKESISDAMKDADGKITQQIPNWKDYNWTLTKDCLSVQVGNHNIPILGLYYYVDNLIYLAEGTDPDTKRKTFIVGVSGTNPVSYTGWFHEDLDVGKMCYWNQSDSKAGKISYGTNVGLTILKNISDALYKKLQSIFAKKQDPCDIIVTGHSLGGALSPVYALYLKENESKWNISGSDVTVSFYSFAGPTPGNSTFAGHMKKTLGEDQMNLFWNNLDIVPHAWEYDFMIKLPDLYSCVTATDNKYKNIINKLIQYYTDKAGKNYSRFDDSRYTKLTGTCFDPDESAVSSFVKGIHDYFFIADPQTNRSLQQLCLGSCDWNPLNWDKVKPYVEYMAQYFVEAGAQHTSQYFNLIFNDTTNTFSKYISNTYFHADKDREKLLGMQYIAKIINTAADCS